MKLRTINQLKNLKDKTVLVRVDYNVAIKNGRVLDTERLERTYKTINYLLKHRARIILMSHLGRPKTKGDNNFTLKPILKYLNKITKKNVQFVNDCIGSQVTNKVNRLKSGQILLLENLRFYAEEEKNDLNFAKQLSALGNIYINEAFSNSHRKHASVSAITKYLPAYAGFNLINEVNNLNKVLKGYKRPAIAIIGGLKIETKIKVIENFLKKYDYVLIGGALANNFWVSQKINIGKSFYEKEYVKLADQLYAKYKNKIILPIDLKIAKKISSKAKTEIVRIFELNKLKNKNWQIVDIGPKTQIFFEYFIQNANTLVFNGPMGIFEYDNFSHGTKYIIEKVALRSRGPAFGVVGGGETLVVLDDLGFKKWPDFVSSAGGAMLEFLEGKILPGIKPLIK